MAEEGGGEGAMAGDEPLGWEAALGWLLTLPKRRNVTEDEIEDWLTENARRLAKEIYSLPRKIVYEYLQNQHKAIRRGDEPAQPPPLPRFKQSDKWKPVWAWLESLDEVHFQGAAFGSREIAEWLEMNPRVQDELEANQTRHNLFKYIQKCYYIVMKKKKKQRQAILDQKRELAKRKRLASLDTTPPSPAPSEATPTTLTPPSPIPTTSTPTPTPIPKTLTPATSTPVTSTPPPKKFPRTSRMDSFSRAEPSTGILAFPADDDEENQFWTMDKEVVKRKYELICKLEVRLKDVLAKVKEQKKIGSDRRVKFAEQRKLRSSRANISRRPFEDYSSDSDQNIPNSSGEPSVNAWVCTQAPADVKSPKCPSSILSFIYDREAGLNWGHSGIHYKDGVGTHHRKWNSSLHGWDSLARQYKGPGVRLQQEFYSSWMPIWSGYSSNVAVNQPVGRLEAVQKVLDVRFRPSGFPQLVCGCNAAPNELLVYDLISGKSTPLVGHNCQVQAVEYASEGSLVVSCGNNLVKVWDAASAACLCTLGPEADGVNSAGHKKKISAMAVNPRQSCLVATSGGQGDGKLLLWNVSRGVLASDLNSSWRHKRAPSMDALEFCKENILICGSDSAYGGPAIVQIWDVDSLKECATFPAHETYITCVKTNPEGKVIVTGSGDGTVGLFDIRSYGIRSYSGIGRLPLTPGCEVTSVSFSSCGRYIQASSTANSSIVWDTRIMPMEPGPMPTEYPPPLADTSHRKTRALFCLSHGKPMPTAENTGQRAGFVDVGDQGVNDARWFHNAPVLVTVSGNGSLAFWDVTLGQPCVRHIQSHSRCINTVAISPDDEYLCSGGDDQKLVLYEHISKLKSGKWRLTHPLH